jgi:signal transduction histidine kinase
MGFYQFMVQQCRMAKQGIRHVPGRIFRDSLKPFGLRAEIALQLFLLVGAALLLGGFLLLRLGGRELVDQRVTLLTAVVRESADLTGMAAMPGRAFEGRMMDAVARRMDWLPDLVRLELWRGSGDNWRLLIDRGEPRSLFPEAGMASPPGLLAEPAVRVDYPLLWPWTWKDRRALARIEVPVRHGGQLLGRVCIWFSLQGVAEGLRMAQGLVLVYALLYGAVVLACGLYLLDRHVVRPVGRLLATTHGIAAGDLQQRVSEEGPREIADLARSFNGMVQALRNSRAETDYSIRSLRQANRELERTRDDLVRSAKMASVGHLAAGMAHEIGNPLAAMVGYLALLQGELADHPAAELARRMADEADRIDRLVRDLLDYAMPASRQAEHFDPIAVMAEAVALLEHQGALKRITLVDKLPARLPTVHMIRHRLQQVFINLLLNARDASRDGGAVTLAGGCDGGRIRICVSDRGDGIAPKVREHIFDPFFTTKPPGQGRGLGLAVCRRVMEEAGGTIEVDSEPGRGSRFTVHLPQARDGKNEDEDDG